MASSRGDHRDGAPNEGKRVWQIGGLVSGAVLIAIGAVALFMGVSGYRTVGDQLDGESIVGSSDMAPAAIAQEARKAGLPATIELPTCDVADKAVDTGERARCFAQYMRIHALEATGGLTYAQMGRFESASNPSSPAGTNAVAAAAKNAGGNPVSNPQRDVWVTEIALATALNVSYMAGQISIFAIVVAIALLLTGVGLVVLALAVFRRPRAATPAASRS